nr:MAG TPA: hypothetical protein [Caudoviricetes sp.]
MAVGADLLLASHAEVNSFRLPQYQLLRSSTRRHMTLLSWYRSLAETVSF